VKTERKCKKCGSYLYTSIRGKDILVCRKCQKDIKVKKDEN